MEAIGAQERVDPVVMVGITVVEGEQDCVGRQRLAPALGGLDLIQRDG
jgi:hypothetical protein